MMTKYEFTIILAGLSEITEDAANELYEAGCDDGSPASSDGIVWVTFHREARTLDDGIRSAVSDIRNAGFQVARVEIDTDALAELVGATA